MKKITTPGRFGLLLASCGNAFCDCDLYEDNYTWDGFDYQLNSSTMTVEDTCLDAGIVDSTIRCRRLPESIARGVSVKKYSS